MASINKNNLYFFTVLFSSFLFFSTLVNARSLEDILESKEIRFGVVPINPSYATAEPEGCRTDCKWGGPVYEEALLFAKTLGDDIKPKFTRLAWDEQFHNKDGVTVKEASYTPELMASGKIDIYPSHVTKNSWRIKKLDFVILYPSRLMVVVNKVNRDKFKTVAELGGKTAGVEDGTSYQTFLQKLNKTELSGNPIILENIVIEDSLKAVNDKKIDFTVVDAEVAMWSTQHRYKDSMVAFPVGSIDELGWAFRMRDTSLQEAALKFFNEQRDNSNSQVNKVWRKEIGMSLLDFITLISSVKE